MWSNITVFISYSSDSIFLGKNVNILSYKNALFKEKSFDPIINFPNLVINYVMQIEGS